MTRLLKCWPFRAGQSKCMTSVLFSQEAVHTTQWGKGVSRTHCHTTPGTLGHTVGLLLSQKKGDRSSFFKKAIWINLNHLIWNVFLWIKCVSNHWEERVGLKILLVEDVHGWRCWSMNDASFPVHCLFGIFPLFCQAFPNPFKDCWYTCCDKTEKVCLMMPCSE